MDTMYSQPTPGQPVITKGGLWVTFEGPEGCGKTTQLGLLEKRLQEENYLLVRTKQPGGNSPVRQQIRQFLLNELYKKEMDGKVEFMLFCTDRRIDRRDTITPGLERNAIVLSDRENDSTIAYQFFGRDLGKRYADLGHALFDDMKPDLTILYNGPIETLLERAKKDITRGGNESRLDNETIEFHRRVQQGFLETAAHDKHRFVILDATKSIEELHQLTYATVMARRNERLHRISGIRM